MQCDVIVTYCWNRVGYNIIHSLFKLGLKVVVGDTSNKNICSMSKFSVDNFVYANPFEDEAEFIQDIQRAIEKYQPKVIIPTHDESLVLARNIDVFQNKVIFAMESFDLLNQLSNKYEATILANSVGVPCPAFINNYENVPFPIVIKTKFGNSAKGVFFPKNKSEADKICLNYHKDDILIEEFFSGTDFSVDCIRYNNFFKASSYKAIVTKTDGGGTTTQRIIVNMPKLEEYSKRILDKVDYNGVCGLDYKVNEETGKAVFIEINARYTGGLATPIAAGFDIPAIHYSLITTGKYEQPINLKIGTHTKWILGDIIALVTKIVQRTLKKDELKHILSFKADAYDDFRSDDKKAILGEMLYYIEKLIKNRKLNP